VSSESFVGIGRAAGARYDRKAGACAASFRAHRGFTLLEVMVAVAFIGIAMMALLSLHQNNLNSVIQAQDLTRASMLAQQLMSTAEASRFPPPGWTRGDFSRDYPGQYDYFRWEREVDVMPEFPDMRRVSVTIRYGHSFGRSFRVVEFMHNPTPPQMPQTGQGANPGEAQGSSDTDTNE
jgi:type II secretion system protein I